ncbi:MAG: formate dehydrogenase subunit gamma [Desulfomonilaceae bacterium]
MSTKNGAQIILYRFNVLHRIVHLIVMVTFVGVGLTGCSMAFSSTSLAQFFVQCLGGIDNTRSLHRFFAVTLYLCVVTEVVWIIYYKFMLRGRILGPDSMFPSKRDFSCFYHHMQYILGRRDDPPPFERFAWWEKLDYWTLFIGMQTMSLTGLLLWFPEFFSSFLPGYFINLAQVLHVDEGVLAVLYKFFIHTTVRHFRPEVYPGDWTIFTGKTTPEKVRRTHPGEWARLKAAGKMGDITPHEAATGTKR